MSWADHVNKLVAGGQVYAAALLRPDGKVYAQTDKMGLAERRVPAGADGPEGATIAVNEAKGVAEAAANEGHARNGLWINAQKYHLISWNAEKNVGYYKCLSGGATVARTAKTIIVGLWSQEKNPAQSGGLCNIAVEKLADDFIKINY